MGLGEEFLAEKGVSPGIVIRRAKTRQVAYDFRRKSELLAHMARVVMQIDPFIGIIAQVVEFRPVVVVQRELESIVPNHVGDPLSSTCVR